MTDETTAGAEFAELRFEFVSDEWAPELYGENRAAAEKAMKIALLRQIAADINECGDEDLFSLYRNQVSIRYHG